MVQVIDKDHLPPAAADATEAPGPGGTPEPTTAAGPAGPARLPGRAPALGTVLTVRALPEAATAPAGHDPRSRYVETFWLGIIGPSTTFLLRRLAEELDAPGADPGAGVPVDVEELARTLGVGTGGGRRAQLARSMSRAVQFHLASFGPDGAFGVRLRIPALSRRMIQRLPEGLRQRHIDWERQHMAERGVEAMRHRCRRLALSLMELGEEEDAVELQLMRWRYHPAVAHEAARWARARHRAAAQAAQPGV